MTPFKRFLLALSFMAAAAIGCSTQNVSGRVATEQGTGVAGQTIIAESLLTKNVTQTDNSGAYILTVPKFFTGTVAVDTRGMAAVSPEAVVFSNLTQDAVNQNFTAAFRMLNISGRVCRAGTGTAEGGVTLVVEGTNLDGKVFSTSTLTQSDGTYIVAVPYGFSGTVTPSKTGYTFAPSTQCSN